MLRKSNRLINEAYIHSSATKRDHSVSVSEINRWHTARGWSGIGYHYVISRDGKLHTGRDIDKVGAHTRGHNTGSVGICLVGGLGDDLRPRANFTKAQFKTLKNWCANMQSLYPGIKIRGHRDVRPTACPSFDAGHWLRTGEVRL